MSRRYEAVLLIAFGGPNSPAEVLPFLDRVLRGIDIPKERVEEVARHYAAVGGKSPLNEITFRQADSLQKALDSQGLALRVYVGMRNAAPFFVETLRQMANEGVRHAIGFILSSHRTEASWERYQENIAEARAEIGAGAPEVDFCAGWHDHPLFIEVWAESIQGSFMNIDVERRTTPLIFTAHSLPAAMAARSAYVEQLETSARLIAEKLSHSRWCLAYQSRSGKPTDRWLEPDIRQVIRDSAAKGCRELIVAPVGFVCDHVEVLYDLDIEAANIAGDLGVHLTRVSCPNDHPAFIQLMADVIEATVSGKLPTEE
ncbi:MAG: ferrochelatase [Candidatus Binatia bacterium]